MKKVLIVIFGVFFFIACKKKDNTIPDPNPSDPGTSISTPDFTIAPSNFNYPVGTTWVYEVITVNDFYNNGIADPNQSFTTTASYTATISRDTVISPTITGKIIHYDTPGFDGVNNYARGVMYYDPTDLKWHDMVREKFNGGAEITSCLGIEMPLTSTAKWQSTHASHAETTNDSCFAQGFDTISCGLGNVKCIRFKNFDGSTFFWFSNVYGRVKTQHFSYEFLNANQTTTKLSSSTLTSFHL